jgi:hypothetical protein
MFVNAIVCARATIRRQQALLLLHGLGGPQARSNRQELTRDSSLSLSLSFSLSFALSLSLWPIISYAFSAPFNEAKAMGTS